MRRSGRCANSPSLRWTPRCSARRPVNSRDVLGKLLDRDLDELAQVRLAPVLEHGDAEPARGRVGHRQADQAGPGIVLGDAAGQNGYAATRCDEFELLLDGRGPADLTVQHGLSVKVSRDEVRP